MASPMMNRFDHGLLLLCVALFASIGVAKEVNAGFDPYAAAQVMVDSASHSWEWGTAAEALLELYNPELSVFGSKPFPQDGVPAADPSTFALAYAKQFINRNSQVLVGNSAVGDPASLGVSAILLGQSDSTYLDASDRQASYLLEDAPRWSNGAISHRPDVAELWADNVAMSFPFLAYLAVQTNNVSLMAETVRQCGLYRDVLKTSQKLNWRHIIGPQSQDEGLWATGNGWAGYAYRMATNDPSMFPQKYITWADTNRRNLAGKDTNGIFSPAVNPYSWLDHTQYTSGSPEGQAFMVYLYTSYRDCVNANICAKPASSGTTISKPGIGPVETITMLNAPITFSAMPQPTGNFEGCECTATSTTCGPHQSCDLNGCGGKFNGLAQYAQCTGNFEGCECTATNTTCGPHQSCDLNGCAGKFNGLTKFAQCTGNFIGCECEATKTTCGAHQSCDLNGCAGKFDGLAPFAKCTGNFQGCDQNFIGCECIGTGHTCGDRQSCDLNNCKGAFSGSVRYAQWMPCNATPNTCGSPQSCGLNGCAGAFSLSNGKAYCTNNFVGCECAATPGTCGDPQSCDMNNCQGAFSGSEPLAQCTGFFKGCKCKATATTCGKKQSCDLNGCAGGYDSNGVARCQGNFIGCECVATKNTCNVIKNCDLNGCNGSFDSNSNTARCRGHFAGCVCNPVASTCGTRQSCSLNGCKGGFVNGNAVCLSNYYGCPCIPDPIWIPPPPQTSNPGYPPLESPWYCVGIYIDGNCGPGSGSNGVICNGDLTQECAEPGIALYKSRTCRTHCAQFGDSSFCTPDFTDGQHFDRTLSAVLICDRALP
ncbi:hypothetical protein ACCO45_000051 [Purpureocillium lilacinum]|uniref:Uncharacterized protein n=1 Tax=Purpureocillium lilacinum TaxID=33203 RepID=A0ACC4E4F2_PURLI